MAVRAFGRDAPRAASVPSSIQPEGSHRSTHLSTCRTPACLTYPLHNIPTNSHTQGTERRTGEEARRGGLEIPVPPTSPQAPQDHGQVPFFKAELTELLGAARDEAGNSCCEAHRVCCGGHTHCALPGGGGPVGSCSPEHSEHVSQRLSHL